MTTLRLGGWASDAETNVMGESDEGKVHAALSRAVQQLENAVKEQETAVNPILGLAERVYDHAPSQGFRLVADAIMEACAFQDVTGQRIRKVARLIRYLRDQKLVSAGDLPQEASAGAQSQGGLTQEQIDRLLSGGKV